MGGRGVKQASGGCSILLVEEGAIAHKCDTETLYISYLLRLHHETGLEPAGGAGAEFDQCGIEGILILTCD